MNLREFLNSLTPAEQAGFAIRCRTTIGYLRNALSSGKKIGESICINIDRESAGHVRCEEIRPDVDWAYIRYNATIAPGNAPFECGVSDPRCTSDRRHHPERREDLLPNEPTNPKAA